MSNFQFQTDAFAPETVSSIKPTNVVRVVNNALCSKPHIVMVGMHLTKTRGGITTLTAGILGSRLKEKYDLAYIESQAEELGQIRKLGLATGAVSKFVFTCIFRRPELAYIHVGSNASLYRESAFIVLARILGLKTISHFHAGDIEKYMPQQPTLGRAFIRWALGCSHKIIAVSAESAVYLNTLLPESNISVLPNAIDMSWLDRPFYSINRGDGDGKTRILFVGALGRLKGEGDLVKALSLLRNLDMNIRVSFVGYGADGLADLCDEAGIGGMVEHLGPVPMDQRANFYHRADIFVLPTYAEAMPIAVMEAMAAGLPVITTPVGGIPEIIDDGKEGILYPCGDVQALAKIIAHLVEDKAGRKRMGDLAKKRVNEEMSFDRYIDGLECEIERVRGGHS